MTNTHFRKTALICQLISGLYCMAACSVASAQKDVKVAPSRAGLDRARQLIRETPCPGDFHNPLAVIRSVNCLHSIGKKQTISLLLEVASPEKNLIVSDPDDDERPQVRVLERHDQRVCTIVPLLFQMPEQGTPPPDPWYCKRTQTWRWAAGTQVSQGGIPFSISGQWTYGGRPYPTRPLVEWAAEHGELLAKRLHPQDDPLQAADALHDRVAADGVVEFSNWFSDVVGSTLEKVTEDLQGDLRAQAIKMLPREMQNPEVMAWDKLRQKVAQTGIRWDPKTEAHKFNDERNDRSHPLSQNTTSFGTMAFVLQRVTRHPRRTFAVVPAEAFGYAPICAFPSRICIPDDHPL